MKTIETQLPNGRILEIQVPDNWSDAQINAEVDRITASAGGSPGGRTPIGDMPWYKQLQIGVGRGMVNVGRQLGNIAGLIPDAEMAGYAELDRPLLETTAGNIGSLVGEVATLAPVGAGAVGLAARGASRAVPALRTAAASRPIATGAATGAAEGALEGAVVGGPGRRGEGAAMGAVAGGLTGGLLPTIAHGLIRPTPEAQHLMRMGVDLTPGQMQPSGYLNLLEQSLHSVSSMVREAGESAKLETAQKIIQSAAPPGAKDVRVGDVRRMLSDIYDQYKPAYGKLNRMPVNPAIRQQLETGFRRAIDDPDSLAGDEERKIVKRFLDNQLSRLRGKELKAGDILSVRSKIRSKIADAKRGEKWDIADLLGTAEAHLTDDLNRGLPQQARAYNQALDSQYSKFKVAEDALYRMGAKDFPTTHQWNQAIKKGVPRGAYARGGGRLRPDVEAMGRVFETVNPSTGARVATLGGAAGLGTGAMALDPITTSVLGAAALPLFGTQAGRQASAGMLPWQTGLAQLLQQVPSLSVFPRGMAAIGVAEQQ